MPVARITMTGDWKRLKSLLEPGKVLERFKKEVGRATIWNARAGAAEIRKHIKAGKALPPNAPLTIAIKRSSKPLVDSAAGLFQAITASQQAWNRAFAGVLRTTSGKKYNLALALHEGASLPVTAKMRAMFEALARAYDAKSGVSTITRKISRARGARKGALITARDAARKHAAKAVSSLRGRAAELWQRNPDVHWRPLRKSTAAIKIPGRPFIREPILKQSFIDACTKRWRDAVAKVLNPRKVAR